MYYVPHKSKNKEFLRIEWKFGDEICCKDSCNRFGLLEPDCQQTKYGRTTNSRKKSTPIITNSEIGSSYFNAEQYTFTKKGINQVNDKSVGSLGLQR